MARFLCFPLLFLSSLPLSTPQFVNEPSCGPIPTLNLDSFASIDKCQFPYLVHIEAADGAQKLHDCSGIFLESGHVLTAVHCVNKQPDPFMYTAFFGLYDKERKNDKNVQIRKVVGVARHPRADLALLELESEVIFTAAVQPAIIFQNDEFMREEAITTGIGFSPRYRTQVENPLMPQKRCAQKLGTKSEVCVKKAKGEKMDVLVWTNYPVA